MTAPRRWDAPWPNEYGSAWRQCQRKTCYRTRGQARVAIKRARRAGLRQELYRCRICGGWHVTTKKDV
jgi:hypothetical protein